MAPVAPVRSLHGERTALPYHAEGVDLRRGIERVPVVSSSGVTSIIHYAGIPSMPGVLRLLEHSTVRTDSGQKIGSFHSGTGSRRGSCAAYRCQ